MNIHMSVLYLIEIDDNDQRESHLIEDIDL